jgi:membrane protein YqaA with SNARE-associated domain
VTEVPSRADARYDYRRIAVATLTLALALAGALWLGWPEGRRLVSYGLYAIPAHLLVSVLANEPALFAAARSFPPMQVAVAGVAGALVAIALDYALIGWFVNHRLIRAEIDDSRGYQRAQRLFGRAPFLLIVAAAMLPVPFYPIKILAIARDYSLPRFAAAIVIGRLPRFYLLALGGQKVQAPNSALASAAVALGLIAAWGAWRTWRRNRLRRPSSPGQA